MVDILMYNGETEWSTTMMMTMMMIVRKKKYLRSCFRPHCDPSRLLLRLPGDSRRSSRIRRVGMWGWSWRSRSGAPLWVTWVRWDEILFFYSILEGRGVEYRMDCMYRIVRCRVVLSCIVSSRLVSSLVLSSFQRWRRNYRRIWWCLSKAWTCEFIFEGNREIPKALSVWATSVSPAAVVVLVVVVLLLLAIRGDWRGWWRRADISSH